MTRQPGASPSGEEPPTSEPKGLDVEAMRLLQEIAGPGPSPKPSRSGSAVGPEGASGASAFRLADNTTTTSRMLLLPASLDWSNYDQWRDGTLYALHGVGNTTWQLKDAGDELRTLRETNARLNRRCQQAESAAAEKVESVRSDLMKTGVRGRPLGRMLANFRCAQLEEELELARKVVAAFEQFEADEQGVFGPHIGTTRLALAEYRAAYPVKP